MADGVYAVIATDEGWAVGNAGIIDLGDHTVVFDTFANHLAAVDLKAAERATGRTVDYVLNSHPHRDHFRGNQVFDDANIVANQQPAKQWPKHGRSEAKESGKKVLILSGEKLKKNSNFGSRTRRRRRETRSSGKTTSRVFFRE